MSATTPLTLSISSSPQQPLTLRASQIVASPTEIRLGDFATLQRASAPEPLQQGLRSASVIITKPEQALFTRISMLTIADVAVGQSVTVTQSPRSAYLPHLFDTTIRVARHQLAPPVMHPQ